MEVIYQYQRQMSFMDAVTSCFNKYATFSGRAQRSEFWWFYLFSVVAQWALMILGGMVSVFAGLLLGWGAALVLLLPSLAVSCRRMHDIGKGGGWIFILLVPIIGVIWWIVLCCQNSEQGPNRFGPEPGVEEAAQA